MRFTEKYSNDIEKVIACIPHINLLSGKGIVVTGATGMICSAVADVLFHLNKLHQAGIKIMIAGRSQERVQQRFPQEEPGRDYRFIPFDATGCQLDDIKTDYIINGASYADPASFTKMPVEVMLSNMTGLHLLLETARKNEHCRLLHVSTSEVYGRKASSEPYREDDYGFVDILKGRACYPSSKRAAETLCVAYTEEYDVDTVMVRPGHIYGPSITETDSRASSEFIRKAAAGEDIVMKSAGTQMRSYCHTLDCASAILTVLLNGVRGCAYNISNKDAVVSIREMAEAMAKAGHVKIVFENPSDLEKKGYNMMDNSSLDASRLEALGWKALFNMEEGAKRSVEEYKNNDNDNQPPSNSPEGKRA